MAVPPFGRFDDLIVEMRTRAAPGGWPRRKTLPIAGCHDRRLRRPLLRLLAGTRHAAPRPAPGTAR